MSQPTGAELYEEGRLGDAIEALGAAVKRKPVDQASRSLLSELLCVAGNIDRADKQLDVLSNQDPGTAVGVAMFRQLLRAEQARQQFYSEGRVPEFLGLPGERLGKHLEAAVALLAGDGPTAARLLAEADTDQPTITGNCNGEPFSGWRDLDDLTAPLLEVLTSNGKFFWVPIDRVASISFEPPKRPRDLLWRSAEVDIQDGPDGVVFIPAIYPSIGLDGVTDAHRLGRETEWAGDDDGPMRGLGQRTFLVGEQDMAIMDIEHVEFDQR